MMNCYGILGITPNAELKDINSAYKKLALKHHPDKTGADEDHLKFQKIQQAVEILRDSSRREKHDVELLSRCILREEAMNTPKPDTSSWGWAASSPDLSALRSMSGRYMYSYANSVHMDPYSPESQEEVRRCEREREYGEQLKRECEQWEAYEGDPVLSGYTWTYDPETEEMMRQDRGKGARHASVTHDEEQVDSGEVLDEKDGQERCAAQGDMASTNVDSEFGEEYSGEEDQQYEEQEEDEGYEEGNQCNVFGGYDQEKEKVHTPISITSSQQTQAEYESAQQTLLSDSEDLLDMTSIGEPVDPADETGFISEKESDTDENETFHSLTDGGFCSNGGNAAPQTMPIDEPSPSSHSLLGPLIPHFREKLNHPSGRYTEEDIHTELRGLVMESFCGWLEDLRLEVPGAEPASTVQVSPEHCHHLGYWNKEFGSSECEICHRWVPIYTLSCPGCGIRACVGCKFQYEE
ncbi:DnaJ domain-containing protein [Aspergillus bertholletiae]|uniref:DnaJ domain-containing protein n=1 Tax=Aspergillus bertholletiae TaxID=1226010 RepID=A0A5N7B408_9EURO|nr:DnaJ domain-containing protein [Aspergillus bertholletiae]